MKAGIVPAEFFFVFLEWNLQFLLTFHSLTVGNSFEMGKHDTRMISTKAGELIYLLRGSYRLNLRWFKVVQIHVRWSAFRKLRHFNPWFFGQSKALDQESYFVHASSSAPDSAVFFSVAFSHAVTWEFTPHYLAKKGALLVHHNLKYQIL